MYRRGDSVAVAQLKKRTVESIKCHHALLYIIQLKSRA